MLSPKEFNDLIIADTAKYQFRFHGEKVTLILSTEYTDAVPQIMLYKVEGFEKELLETLTMQCCIDHLVHDAFDKMYVFYQTYIVGMAAVPKPNANSPWKLQ